VEARATAPHRMCRTPPSPKPDLGSPSRLSKAGMSMLSRQLAKPASASAPADEAAGPPVAASSPASASPSIAACVA